MQFDGSTLEQQFVIVRNTKNSGIQIGFQTMQQNVSFSLILMMVI